MMAYVDETDGADRTEALLWAAPTGQLPAPPIDTRAQVLPIGDLDWPEAERLFLRLLHTVRPVQYAKLFGVPGQAQAGIRRSRPAPAGPDRRRGRRPTPTSPCRRGGSNR